MPNEPLILVVDDDAAILRLMRMELPTQGFRVVTANKGEEALKTAEQQRPDLVLLDVVMPDMGGFEIMRNLRDRSNVPIIMLTGKGGDEDKVRGLELGADDYIVKPFSTEEISARVKAVLRRGLDSSVGANNVVQSGNVEIDLGKHTVKKDGELMPLTRTEWLLLQCLASNAGKVMLNKELLTKVWGPEYVDDVQYLRVWVSRLRSKVEADSGNPALIKTMPGLGYIFETVEAASA